MATVKMTPEDEEPVPEETRMRLHKRIEAKDYEVKRARHDAFMWEHLAEEEGIEILMLKRKLAEAKRHRLYERIAWLLLSTSLVLAHHL